MSDKPSPTVRRRRLGIELRRLREAAGLTIEEVAERLERSASTVSRIETGKTIVHVRDVRDMLDMYGVNDERRREELFAIAREARQSGWWESYPLADDFEAYIGLEAEAAQIRAFDVSVIHGLLQTEAYARAVFQAGHLRDEPEGIEKQVALRMRRQAVLRREPEPLQIWTIQDEAVLRREVGGRSVMRAQLAHLIAITTMPNVTIQLLPFSVGAHAGMRGSFALIEPAEPQLPPALYVESAGGNQLLERHKDLSYYSLVFDDLRSAALEPAASAAWLRSMAAEIDDSVGRTA